MGKNQIKTYQMIGNTELVLYKSMLAGLAALLRPGLLTGFEKKHLKGLGFLVLN